MSENAFLVRAKGNELAEPPIRARIQKFVVYVVTFMAVSLGSATATSIAGEADAWPQFRGPEGQGHSPAANLPTAWSESDHVLWKTAVSGRAWSSPVISDGICWLTTAVFIRPAGDTAAVGGASSKSSTSSPESSSDSISLRVVAVDLSSGEIRHDIELFQQRQPEAIHALNSYASPTPVLKHGRLFCHFGNLGSACVEAATAKILWKTRLASKHGVGPGSSPVIYDNLLIIPCDGMDAQFVTALDIATGQEVWKTNRPPLTGGNADAQKAFSTPLLIDAHADGARVGGERVGGRGDAQPQVVAVGAQWVVAYDPRDGSEIWKVRYGEGFSNAPCPVYANGIVYICTGYMNPELWAIRTDGRGDVSATHVVWQVKKQVPTMSSPILLGNALYMVSEQGVVTCADLPTGKVRFQKRIPGSYSSSPLIADKKLIFSSREGDMIVVAADESWQQLSLNHLNGELMASPAVWRDSLIVRTASHLYRIGEPGRN